GENMPFFDALEKQLGLKLELSTAPLPVIQVDSALEQPTPNPPEVSKILAVPTEFDVAEIRPSPPQSANQPQQPEMKNGRLIVPGITLKNLMTIAWNVPPNADEYFVNTPKWLDSDRFDLIAKAPEGVALGDLLQQNQRSISINVDVLQPMLRTLITQRFKLAMHTEERPIAGYALSAVKPKMEKADPAMRTRWFEGLAPAAGKDNGPNLGRLVTCQNMTMAQFAHLLQDIANGYVHGEVVDNTGLEGGYTFTLRFSPIGLISSGGGRGGDGPPAADSGAATPSGGLSLPDAIQKQLGLKLELQKRPTTVYVIDHIE